MKLFDCYSNMWIDASAKRKQTGENVIMTKYAGKWEKGDCLGSYCPITVNPTSTVPEYRQITDLVDLIRTLTEEAADKAAVVADGRTLEKLSESDIHSIVLGVRDMSFALNDLTQIDYLYDLGFRIMSLTGNGENALASGFEGRYDHGLTDEGRRMARLLSRKGIMLDLSGLNERSFDETAGMIEGPFIVSHGNCYKICGSSQNYYNSQLRAVRDHGGLFCVSAKGPLVSDLKEEWDLKHYCDHVVYAAETIGIDHVALGFNYMNFINGYEGNEYDGFLEDLKDTEDSNNVVEELRSRGGSNEDISKICFYNFLRLLN